MLNLTANILYFFLRSDTYYVIAEDSLHVPEKKRQNIQYFLVCSPFHRDTEDVKNFKKILIDHGFNPEHTPQQNEAKSISSV